MEFKSLKIELPTAIRLYGLRINMRTKLNKWLERLEARLQGYKH